ncbi:hypothetical protein FCN18_00400 [Prauserella endophytica]|uniref:Uncharacterized protein n=1 Tax=Prauserella endophytica TaxID=1592324 RepID=A0ABY2SBM2_9PSEU|nr:hypothetical protein FCN18_00400 [Prauserella endophytica]
MARKIMYGAGRPAGTSSTHTTASITVSSQPTVLSRASTTSRSNPVVNATFTPAARSEAIASGTPGSGTGGVSE